MDSEKKGRFGKLVTDNNERFAEGERAIRNEMRDASRRRAADWPRLFNRDRNDLLFPQFDNNLNQTVEEM